MVNAALEVELQKEREAEVARRLQDEEEDEDEDRDYDWWRRRYIKQLMREKEAAKRAAELEDKRS